MNKAELKSVKNALAIYEMGYTDGKTDYSDGLEFIAYDQSKILDMFLDEEEVASDKSESKTTFQIVQAFTDTIADRGDREHVKLTYFKNGILTPLGLEFGDNLRKMLEKL